MYTSAFLRTGGFGLHKDMARWRHQMETFPRFWSFVRGIHRLGAANIRLETFDGTINFKDFFSGPR